MVLDVTQKEINFIDSIDASFPLEDEEKAKILVSEGAQISDNTALAVAYELITEPPEKFLTLRLSLLEQLYRERPSRAIQVAAPVIISLIKEEPFPDGSVEALLAYCREQKGIYNGLGILSLCSPEMEKEAQSILKQWQ